MISNRPTEHSNTKGKVEIPWIGYKTAAISDQYDNRKYQRVSWESSIVYLTVGRDMSGYWSTNFLALSPPSYVTFDLSGYFFQSQEQIRGLRNAWNMYEQVQVSNIQVSTNIGTGALKLGSGTTDPCFYQFRSMEDKNNFMKGQMLHTARYPYINFSTSVR